MNEDRSCRYMLKLPTGEWEYGYQDLETSKKVRQGVTTSPEEAMKLNNMTPMRGSNECSGKPSPRLYAHLPPYSVLRRR